MIAPGSGAAVLNLTATNTGSGFVTAYPAGTTKPDASNLNIATGQTVANLIADVAGWYKN